MTDEPLEVEVLDQDGRPVLPVKRERKHSLAKPTNIVILGFAMIAAFGILLWAIAQVMWERARGLPSGKDDDDPE